MRRLIKRVLLSNVVSFSQTLFNSFKLRVLGNSGVVEADSCAVTTLSNLDARNLLQSATFVLAPSGYKSGFIYSEVPSNGNGDLTVTRATTATIVNSSGVIETVASNVPQLDYSLGGCPNFLFEPQRTNLLTYSEQFNNAAWTKGMGAVVSDSAISPDGNQTADKFTGDGASGNHYLGYNYTFSAVAYSYNCYIKAGTNNYIQIRFGGAAGGGYCNFDVLNGVVGTYSGVVGNISNVGNGWYRCSIVYTTLSASSSITMLLVTSNSATAAESNTLSTYIYFWGAQLEQGAYPTSYIPTTSAAVTRNATSFTRSNIYTNGFIGASGFTWLFELKNNIQIIRDASGSEFYIGEDNTSGVASLKKSILLRNSGGNFRLNVAYWDGLLLNNIYVTQTDNLKIAMSYNGTTLNVYVGGNSTPVATSTFTITLSNLEYMNGLAGVARYLSQMALWNTPLSAAQCASLTS